MRLSACLVLFCFDDAAVLARDAKPLPLSSGDFLITVRKNEIPPAQASPSAQPNGQKVVKPQTEGEAQNNLPLAKQTAEQINKKLPQDKQSPVRTRDQVESQLVKPSLLETSFTSWPARGRDTRAAILSIHGFGLHKESFAGFANQMASRGISTYAIDVRGFGSWMGEPGENKKLDFYQTMMDLRSAIYWVKTMNPGVPVFLLGESMGGAIALQATALFPECVSGLIASVPGSHYYGGKKTAMEVALRMVRPNAKFKVGDKVIEKATCDKNLRENWLNDPRAKLEMTPKQLTQFAAFMNQTDDMAKRIDSVPVLMLQGGKDRLSKADGTERLFHALKTPYKNYVLLDDAEHLIFEKGQYNARTAEIVEDWLAKQSQRLRSAGTSSPK